MPLTHTEWAFSNLVINNGNFVFFLTKVTKDLFRQFSHFSCDFSLKNKLSPIQPFTFFQANCHNHKGVKLIRRLTLALSYLREKRFKHGFQDTINSLTHDDKNLTNETHESTRSTRL